jgi:anti-sigma B factor antagonist
MEIQTTQLKHCDVVKVNGRIDSYTAPQLATAFNDILTARRYKIVCDMSEVNYMASAGLRLLISVQKTCKRYNRGEIVLTNVPKRVCESFELAGFAPLFKFFEDPLLAVGHF